MIGRGWEHVFAYRLPKHAISGAHGALHLIEDHAFVLQFAIRVLRFCEFEAVPLLSEI